MILGFLDLPSWEQFQPFIATGLALGGVYALSGVGMVVLYQTTGVLNLAFGAIGAMAWIWSDKARSLVLPTSTPAFDFGQVTVNWTQVIALGLGIVVTFGTLAFLRFTNLGTAMRALANDREIAATLGVPVRRVEAQAWLVSGLLSGAAGLLLSNLVGLDAATLTFLVISSLSAALIARLRSLPVTFFAALVVGLVTALITPIFEISEYRQMTPFVLAVIALLWLSRRRQVTIPGTTG